MKLGPWLLACLRTGVLLLQKRSSGVCTGKISEGVVTGRMERVESAFCLQYLYKVSQLYIYQAKLLLYFTYFQSIPKSNTF